jgi:transglutaminase-like putative cysteine protease
MNCGRMILVSCSLFCLAAVGAAEPTPSSATGLSPAQPPGARQSLATTYDVDFRVAVIAPANTKKLRVWLPLPTSNTCQQVFDRKLETFPRPQAPSIAIEPVFGNTFAYFEFDSPDGAQLITHRFKAQTHQLNWDVDYPSVTQPESWPESFEPFQRPDPRLVEEEQLNQVLAEINAATENVASDRLIGAIEWVDQHLVYDHQVASLSADPMHALVHRRGHCSDYHGLCSTLARNIGFPSCVLYGLQMFDKGSPSHCKLEVFLPPYGWVRYDLSETQKLAIQVAADESLTQGERDARVAKIKARTMRGFQENTWLQVTRGVNYDLVPAAANPIHVVRTIYAEADGKPLPEPDPSNAEGNQGSWMTIHRVDNVSGQAIRFQTLD